MDVWLPRSIVTHFARYEGSRLNGAFLDLPSTDCDAICAALRELGYAVEHAPHLSF